MQHRGLNKGSSEWSARIVPPKLALQPSRNLQLYLTSETNLCVCDFVCAHRHMCPCSHTRGSLIVCMHVEARKQCHMSSFMALIPIYRIFVIHWWIDCLEMNLKSAISARLVAVSLIVLPGFTNPFPSKSAELAFDHSYTGFYVVLSIWTKTFMFIPQSYILNHLYNFKMETLNISIKFYRVLHIVCSISYFWLFHFINRNYRKTTHLGSK